MQNERAAGFISTSSSTLSFIRKCVFYHLKVTLETLEMIPPDFRYRNVSNKIPLGMIINYEGIKHLHVKSKLIY